MRMPIYIVLENKQTMYITILEEEKGGFHRNSKSGGGGVLGDGRDERDEGNDSYRGIGGGGERRDGGMGG